MKTLCTVSPDFSTRALKVKERKSTSLQSISAVLGFVVWKFFSFPKDFKKTNKKHKTLKFRVPKYNGKLRGVSDLLKD